MISWWQGEGNALDGVGTNNGTPTGGITYTNGEVGQAFVFNNSTSYIPLAASPSLNIGTNGGFTIEVWIKPNAASLSYPAYTGVPIVEWDSSSLDGLQLWSLGSGILTANLKDTSGNDHSIGTASAILNASSFQHVALTYDKSSGLAVLYYNGAIVATNNFGSIIPQTSDSAYHLNIGRRTGQPVQGGQNYGGLMDEMSIYNRALTSNEIASIYGAGSYGKCVPVLPPFIITQPANQTVTAGQTATFSVTAGGTAPLSYQWSYNGTNIISGATNAVLTLSNVQIGQAGNYSVQVTNILGSTNSASAVLTVNPPPTCYPTPSGMISWWQGESNALDSAGANNGVLMNGTGFAPGEVGTAFNFNGANNFVLVNPPSTNLDVGQGGGFTMEGWIKPATVSSAMIVYRFERIMGSTSGSDIGMEFSVHSPGILFANIVDTSQGAHILGSSNNALVVGAWQHIALTYDKTTGLAVGYVNGVSVMQQNIGNITPQTTFTNLLIGAGTYLASASSPANTFSGGMDEMSIYNRTLTSNEIASIYGAGSYGKCVPVLPPFIITQPANQTVTAGQTATFSVTAGGTAPLSYQWSYNGTNIISGATNAVLTLSNVQIGQAGNYSVQVTNILGSTNSASAVLTVNPPPTCYPTPSGMISWWQGEGNALDGVGTNNGTPTGGITYTNGEVGQAFVFNNSTSYIPLAASPSLNIGTNGGFTIEVWIKPNAASLSYPAYTGVPIVEWDSSSLDGLQLWSLGSGILTADLKDTSGNDHSIGTASAILNASSFQHVALTYDKSSGLAVLYYNGAIVATNNFGSIIPQTSDSAYHLNIGRRTGQPVQGGQNYGGLMDEMSIYNRALTSNEIASIYGAGSYGKCVPVLPPFIITQPANQTVTAGQTATFSVTAGGTAPLSYQWSYNGTNIISGATNAVLTLSNVQIGQAGNYSVQVTNILGSTNSASAALIVNFPPATIQILSTNAPGGTSVVVPVVIVANGNENALSFSLNFDTTRLTYSDIALGAGAQDAFLLPNLGGAASGNIGMTLLLPPGETLAAGTQQVAVLTFNAPILSGTQSVATAISFTNQPIIEAISDVSDHQLATNFINGTVTLTPSPLEGDAAPLPNGNGSLDIFDVVQVGRFVVGLDAITNSSEFQRVDCAPRSTLGDGIIDITDWVQADRYAAGLDPLTLAGGPTSPVTPSGLGKNSVQKNGLISRQVSIASGMVVKGLTITLPVNLQAQGNENAMGFSLNFDPTILKFSNVVKGGGASAATFNVNTNLTSSGEIGVALLLPVNHQFTAGTVEVADVTFIALMPETNYSVTFASQPAVLSISDTNANHLAANYVNDSITINPVPMPAANFDTSGTNLSFQWPTWAGDFVLQSAASIVPPIVWTNVPITTQTNNGVVQVVLPTLQPQGYYRLYHP